MRGSAAGGSSGPKIVCPSNTIRKSSDAEVSFVNGSAILKEFVMGVTGVVKIQYDIIAGTNAGSIWFVVNNPYIGQIGNKGCLAYDAYTQQNGGLTVDIGNSTIREYVANETGTEWVTKKVEAGDILYILGYAASAQGKIKNVKIMYDEVTDEVIVK